jgi:hypothetical protein
VRHGAAHLGYRSTILARFSCKLGIQLNVIAGRMLGLPRDRPDPPGAD